MSVEAKVSSRTAPTRSGQGKPLLLLAAAVGVTLAYALWGGLPPAEQVPAFLVGVAALLGVIALFGGVGWHLLVRSLPAGKSVPRTQTLPARLRLLLAVLLSVVSLNVVVGGVWDEVWHRKYGLPFGDDFFWRPHLMMYSFFASVALIAFAGLFYIMRNGKGTMQQRFRANPVVGLLVLVGGFMMFALPADPAWHALYGVDLSAWSLPHIVLFWSFVAVMFLIPALVLTTIPPRVWGSIARIRFKDVFILLAYVFVMTLILLLLTTEWDSAVVVDPLLLGRPDWLLPVNILLNAVVIGTLANHSTRYFGAATLVGVCAVVMRVGLLALLDYDGISVEPWLLALPPMIALDLWYGFNIVRRRAAPHWVSSGVVAGLGMLPSLPLINTFFVHPQISPGNLPVIVIACALAGIGGAWFGATLGDLASGSNKQVAEDPAVERPVLRLVTPAAFVAVLVFIVVFVFTAAPPV